MFYRVFLSVLVATFCVASWAADPRICRDYVSRIPGGSVALCEAAGLTDLKVRSVQGRTLWGTDVRTENAGLRVLVLGGIHGDEMSSVSLVHHWISLARQGVADMPHGVHWRFVPSLNPDGLFAHPSKRVNARGVDLNRNFPTPNWSRDAKDYWEKRTRRDPRRWPGKTPLSEPESKYVVDQIAQFKPHLIVSVHAPFGVLDFDGPTVPPSRLGRLYLDQVGIYPGSLGNYGGVHKGVPVVTIELGSASQLPQDGEIRQMWLDLLRWMTERIKPQ
ncbi:MAG: murein peptide amidase A [Rhodoferax sp.]|nr:MAG: murein peptide amidase A [Rhodoferax sp.]